MTRTVVPGCPNCGALVSRSRPHVCRVRSSVPWPTAVAPTPPARSRLPEPVTDPAEVRERIAACRAVLASTAPPESAPAGSMTLYRDHTL